MGNRVVFMFGSEKELVEAIEVLSPEKLLDEFSAVCSEYHHKDQDSFFEAVELIRAGKRPLSEPRTVRETFLVDLMIGIVFHEAERFGLKSSFGRWSNAGTINVSHYHSAYAIVEKLFSQDVADSWRYLLDSRAFGRDNKIYPYVKNDVTYIGYWKQFEIEKLLSTFDQCWESIQESCDTLKLEDERHRFSSPWSAFQCTRMALNESVESGEPLVFSIS